MCSTIQNCDFGIPTKEFLIISTILVMRMNLNMFGYVKIIMSYTYYIQENQVVSDKPTRRDQNYVLVLKGF